MNRLAREEKILALVNTRLDAKLKEAEIAEKTKPWRSLTSPTTLMALITVVVAVLGAFVNVEQFWGSKQSEEDARAATELIAERGLVSNVMQQPGSDLERCKRLSQLAIAGLFPQIERGLDDAGLVKLQSGPHGEKFANCQ